MLTRGQTMHNRCGPMALTPHGQGMSAHWILLIPVVPALAAAFAFARGKTRVAQDFIATAAAAGLICGLIVVAITETENLKAAAAERLDTEIVTFVDAQQQVHDRYGRYTTSLQDLRVVSPEVAEIVDEGATKVELVGGDVIDTVTIRLEDRNAVVSRALTADE